MNTGRSCIHGCFFMNTKHCFALWALFKTCQLYHVMHLRSVWDKQDEKDLFGFTSATQNNIYQTSQHTANEIHTYVLRFKYAWFHSAVTTEELVQIVTEHETDVYVICWPPPQRKQRARSFPVPRGSMATGGCLAKLDLSVSAKKKMNKKRLKWMIKMISGFVTQWNMPVFSPYLLLNTCDFA